MKQLLFTLVLLTTAPLLRAQTSVPVGAGSYASFPPGAVAPGPLRDFVYNKPLYVVRSKKNGPIPTNDWWTDLLVRGKDAGLLWVYPLVADPDPNGLNLNFPNSINVNVPSTAASSGGSYDMAYGGNMRVTATGYTPSTALAESWSDWGLVMSLPDTTTGKNMIVSMAHGVPFVWVETQGISPKFNFERDATYLAANGTPLTLPTRNSFVVNTDGRYFGVHVAPGSTVELRGQQSVTLDLGSRRAVSTVRLVWEAAFASAYDVLVSDDKVTWQRVYSTTTSPGGTENITALTPGAAGRYVRLLFNKRATNFGYSLFEMQVFDGSTLVSQSRPVEVTSTQPTGNFSSPLVNDGNLGTRWASDATQQPQLMLTPGTPNSYFVVSALNATTNQAAGQRLAAYETYAYNKVTDTQVDYGYDPVAGKVNLTWRLTTQDLRTSQPGGPTLQGFLPHLYQNAAHSLAFTGYDYLSPRGTLKTVAGTSFPFAYDFQGVIPSYTAPVSRAADANPYNVAVQNRLVTAYAQNPSNREDTYFGGKDVVLQAKYALLAKELNHPAAAALKTMARATLVNWLTYQAGERSRYFARYDRWKALIGFNPSFGSEEFVDNHFHYGYFTLACAIYNMVDPTFLQENQYGGMARLVAKQYANWDKTNQSQPWLRTFDPWTGHSYAGGTSSGNGNNQESSSEAMQSWIGLFLLGDALNDPAMRAAGAFGYTSEAAATLEYWFDWKQRNFPAAFAARRQMGAILSNQGLAHATYFGAQEKYVHGIQYLPVNPGLSYLARDTAWARREYNNLLAESRAAQGYATELDFEGDDWSHVALGFKYLSDPKYVTKLLAENLRLPTTDPRYIMDEKEVSGITYFYAHAQQNLGYFSSKFHTNFPTSSVFERNGIFSYAVAYNPSASAQTCTVYNAQGGVVTSAVIPPRTLLTFPAVGTPPTTPTGPCTNLVATSTVASTASQPARNATDGNSATRWESAFSDQQDLTVDYGRTVPLTTVTIVWERASAKDYRLLGSVDGTNWQELAVRTNLPVSTDAAVDFRRTDVLSVTGSYRYLRMAATARTTVWGYSIFELTTCSGTAARTALATAGGQERPHSATSLTVWPNPAHSGVRVAGATPGQVVQVLDVQGRVVRQQTVLNDAPLELALPAELARGLYLVRCGSKSSRLTLE
ncbi:glycosyl hydrolase [Hymenobacter tibetensis]|uniref:glucan endo-1,3-beta-D-glucosidase n=1 Tax=Hymenobacter tibetensis TaxID=497967 RepID=A0ABY4CWN3_9BACT|nr:glycosyl hydrolase [Hymenobacter tibetensis]UOG73409.1 glycosyl hydrolase [Hymenobacter tibetensis]